MPKVKKNLKYNKKYTESTLQQALNEIKSGVSKKQIAMKYGIPRSTLQFRLGPNFSKIELGHSTYLSKEEEDKLVSWILESHRKGFPRRKLDIQLSVKDFLDANRRPNPFRDNTPGDRWYRLFLNRHPVLTERIPEGVTAASANVSEENIKGWFTEIEIYLKEKGHFSILQDPLRVYNGDETCFQFCPKVGKVVAPKGAKNVYEVDRGEAKQNLTVMFTFSASGITTPPLIIFPNKRLPRNVLNSVPDGWGIGLSDNGWMKSGIFVDYIKNVFHPYLQSQGVEFPIILFLDGHKTHLTYDLSQLCTDLKIILIALYPNSTRIMQPADVSSFRPLKNLWKNGVLEWRRKNPYCKLSKEHFAPILKNAVTLLKPETAANGFRACGLHPWDSQAIDYEKCLGKANTRNAEQMNSETQHDNEPNVKTITFEQFCGIVGENTIHQLNNDSNQVCNDEICQNFQSLKLVYEKLKPNFDESLNEVEVKPDSAESLNDTILIVDIDDLSDFNVSGAYSDEIFLTDERIKNIPIIFSDLPQTNNIIVHENILLKEGLTKENINNHEKLEKNETESSCIGLEERDLLLDNMKAQLDTIDGDLDPANSESIVKKIENSKDHAIQTKTNKIEEYLPHPETPQRTGKRQSERAPFVLTSTVYKKIVEEKERIKEEKERKKEENKQKRLLKSLEQKKVVKTVRHKKQKTLGLSQKEQNVKLIKNLNTSDTHTYSNSILKENVNHSYVRNLFKTPEKQSSPLPSKIVVPRESPLPSNNIIISKGVCFTCAYNIYRTNIGIKCNKCTRTYHFSCLKKYGEYKDNFVCRTCGAKANVY